MRDINDTCCFTGHRIISNEDKGMLEKNLEAIIIKLYESGIRNYISGGALGFDTMAAKKVLELRRIYPDIRLIMAIPCRNQEAKWNSAQKITYNKILESADERIYVSERYTYDCMHKRNRFMVDSSSIVIAYIVRPSGGTVYTVSYAIDCEKRVINVITME